MHETKKTAVEVCNVLDSLAALSQDLACHKDAPREAMVLSAAKTQEACEAIEAAVTSLREILEIAVASGGGPIPPAVADRLEDAAPSE